MNLKSTLFGALITLIITILGGLVVFYLTDKGELLTYWYDAPAIFEKDSTSIVLQTIYLSNAGNEKATNVSAEVNYPDGIIISDKNVAFSTGKIAIFNDSIINNRSFILLVPTLLPKENIKISFILKSKLNSNPEVSVKSNSTIGKISEIGESMKKKRPIIEIGFLIFLLLLQLTLVAFLVYISIKRKRLRIFGSEQSPNNTAFLLLHKNLPNYATKILDEVVFKAGADAYLLGNYALAKSIEGNFSESLKLIEAAKFYSKSDQEKMVNLFNKSLIYILKGELQIARKCLEDAIAIDAKEIKKYVEFSDLIKTLRANNEIDSIFKDIVK